MPIIGVINHLTHVEWRWINGRYLGEPFPPRDEEFVLGPEVTGAEIVAAYAARARAAPRRSCARRQTSRRRASAAKVTGLPAHELLGLPQPIDLRWTLLHLIEETAHHAGHTDATREMLDGTRADELLHRVRRRSRT